MAKKSAKGKEKKELRKQQGNKARLLQQLLAKADQDEDLLAGLGPLTTFVRLGLSITACRACQLSPEDAAWAFSLCKSNMEGLYNQAWGWEDLAKRKELASSAARFLIARDAEGQPHAFAHFRFEDEAGEPVLYVYEIQLDGSVQRQGLGGFMMGMLGLIARQLGMARLMLTVINANVAAMALYRRLGYSKDPSSPEEDLHDPPHFQILTKAVAPLLQPHD